LVRHDQVQSAIAIDVCCDRGRVLGWRAKVTIEVPESFVLGISIHVNGPAYRIPVRLRWRHVVHKIRRLEGPERIAMAWWDTPAPDRDYFRAEDEEGRRFWLYREQGTRWFLHGVFA